MNVYSLEWDLSHLRDTSYDLAILGSKHDAESLRRKLMKSEKLVIDKPIEFLANLHSTANIDFPVSGGFPVMSHHMIQSLSGVANFKLFEYPVLLIDDTFLDGRYEPDGSLKEMVKRLTNFSLIQTLEIFEGLDYSRSDFAAMQPGQLFPTVINNFVLLEPPTGFPPLFRVIEKRSVLFVSEDAKLALQANNVKGCLFKEYDVTRFQP
jgi:hypothetical protein